LTKEKSEPQSPSLYELAWCNARDAIAATDYETGLIVAANPACARLSGYSLDEFIGMHYTQLYPESERERLMQAFETAAQKDSSFNDFHLLRKDGSLLPVNISGSMATLPNGRRASIAIVSDITELASSREHIAVQNWALTAYAGAASALVQATDSQSLLNSICDAITHESAYVLALVCFAENDAHKSISYAAFSGSAKAFLQTTHATWNEEDAFGRGPGGTSLRTGELQLMNDVETFTGYEPWRERALQYNVRSAIAVPFFGIGDRRGALVVYSAYANAFQNSTIEVFKHLAFELGHGLRSVEQDRLLQLEREQLVAAKQSIAESLVATVSAMTTTMEMRDPYTAGHENRVTELAVAIANEMGWSEDKILGLKLASLVHDIGKISVPAELLTKPTRLSPAELSLIQSHSEAGYQILKKIPFVWPVADIVRQHHEKLDGTGYPLGIKADLILPESRVLAVADIVEAMSTARPYRAAISLDVTLQEVESMAGTKLDAVVVRICVDLFRNKNFEMSLPILA